MVATIIFIGHDHSVSVRFCDIRADLLSAVFRPVDLQISDTFKILYLFWFILDTIRLYSVKYKFVRAISFIVLAFGTFTLWRLYGFPVFMKISYIK